MKKSKKDDRLSEALVELLGVLCAVALLLVVMNVMLVMWSGVDALSGCLVGTAVVVAVMLSRKLMAIASNVSTDRYQSSDVPHEITSTPTPHKHK